MNSQKKKKKKKLLWKKEMLTNALSLRAIFSLGNIFFLCAEICNLAHKAIGLTQVSKLL